MIGSSGRQTSAIHRKREALFDFEGVSCSVAGERLPRPPRTSTAAREMIAPAGHNGCAKSMLRRIFARHSGRPQAACPWTAGSFPIGPTDSLREGPPDCSGLLKCKR